MSNSLMILILAATHAQAQVNSESRVQTPSGIDSATQDSAVAIAVAESEDKPSRLWTMDLDYSGAPSEDGSAHGLSLSVSRQFEMVTVRVVPSLTMGRQLQFDPDTAWNEATLGLALSRGFGPHLSLGLSGWAGLLSSPLDYGGSTSIGLQAELVPPLAASAGIGGAWSLSGSWSGNGRIGLAMELVDGLDASLAGTCLYSPLTDLPISTSASKAPYVPQWGAEAALDFSVGDWSITPQGTWSWFRYTKSETVSTAKGKSARASTVSKPIIAGSYEVLGWSLGASVGWSATEAWWLWSSFTWGWNSEDSDFRVLNAKEQSPKRSEKLSALIGESSSHTSGPSWGAGVSYSF
jgi:hypothetical protein